MLWNSSFSTGLTEIDAQNSDLISRLRAMIEADTYWARIMQLVRFEQAVTEYFKREQTIHDECGYYAAEIHRFTHEGYLKHLRRMRWKYIEEELTLENEMLFMKDVVDLLLKHILNQDRSFAEFYHRNILNAKAQ